MERQSSKRVAMDTRYHNNNNSLKELMEQLC